MRLIIASLIILTSQLSWSKNNIVDSAKYKANKELLYACQVKHLCYDFAEYEWKINNNYKGYMAALDLGCAYHEKDSCDQLKTDEELKSKLKAECDDGNANQCFQYSNGLKLLEGNKKEAMAYFMKGCNIRWDKGCKVLLDN